jgi:hypothetical protein
MSDCKIVIPPCVRITVTTDKATHPWTLARCAEWVVDHDPRFLKSRSGARQADRIANALHGKAEGERAVLSREDVEALSKAMEEPAHGYTPPLFDANGNEINIPPRMFRGYFDAIEAALAEPNVERPRLELAPKALESSG